jgi:1-acyl-sn-glycerol-3-phosphate acyltransferase
MLADCEQRLTDGEILLIFPEATRSTPGQPISFRTGAAELALRTQAPLTTAIIHANTPYLSKSSAWYDFPAERLEYRIVFEPPFTTSSRTGSRRQRRRNLTARLETFYRQALGQVQKSTTADDWPDTHIKEQT